MGRYDRFGNYHADPAWLQQEPVDFDDEIDTEEAGLDEERCPICGCPSTGVCVDCEYEQQDRHLEEAYESAQTGD